MDNGTNKKYIIAILCVVIIFIFFNSNHRINQLKEKIQFQENEIEDLNKTIENKNVTIDELQSSINSLDDNVNTLNDNINDIQEETEEDNNNFNFEFTDGPAK